jgi:porphobilinogen synthase
MIVRRPRRNRKSEAIRSLVRETSLCATDLIQPYFAISGINRREPISSMPGIERLSVDLIIKEASELALRGLRAILLFGAVPQEKKDPVGSEAINPEGVLARAILQIKEALPDLCVIADLALDPYTDHGHDGLLGPRGEVLNDETVEILEEMALVAAHAGADLVAPSDMMDGRVGRIRARLDLAGLTDVGILSYAAKYASAFYGPFRHALQSAPRIGDKKSYQIDPANGREAILECLLDIEEGADILMVKPALPYLDIVAKLRERTHLPIAAYQVSGEYAMIMAASERGWLDQDRAFYESLISIKRAGADMILTYAAASLLRDQRFLSA